jgi:hypothetical protein
MKIWFLLTACLTFSMVSEAQINKLKDRVKSAVGGDQTEIASGLKEALEVGVNKGTDFLSAKDGYYKSMYKILLPNEAQEVINRVKRVPGFANIEDDLIERINRAAEDAATRAKPIFKKAITGMTINDAMNILMGNQNAATQYLHRTTYQGLYDAFQPVIVDALNKVNAIELWESAVTAYNQIPLVKKTNPRLDDHVTQEALKGLFSLIEKEEKEIRTNVNARSSDLLKRVFAQQDKKG